MDAHKPVLLNEVIAGLAIDSTKTYVDATFGRGGHAEAILSRLTTGHLYAFDRDIAAIEAGQALRDRYPEKLTLIHDNFTQMGVRLKMLGVTAVAGILMDLGVSSPQFDDSDRGFTYRDDAALDMRMDQSQKLTAETLVNYSDLKTLTNIFREYGDEPQAYQIAKAIIAARDEAMITTTGQLVTIIKSAKPQRELKKKGHPAKQAFQALRIAVNDEINNLIKTLDVAVKLLDAKGRLAVITFHSGEDRIVKTKFKALTTQQGSRYGPEALKMPQPLEYELYNRDVILPTPEEILENHRANSAKLRIIIRSERNEP